jgi:hypothetical protein
MLQEFKKTLIAKGGKHQTGLDEGNATRDLHLVLTRLTQPSVDAKRLLDAYGIVVNEKDLPGSLQGIFNKMNELPAPDRYNLTKHVFGNHRRVTDTLWVLYDTHRQQAPADIVTEEPAEETPLVSAGKKRAKEA